MVSDILEKAVREALKKLGLETEAIHFEHPADLSHGDYSTNIALVLAKAKPDETKSHLGSPKELAQKIVDHLDVQRPSEVEKVEVAGAGFINFYLTKEFFAESLKKAVNKDFGKNKTLKDKRILIEHSSPNLFKPFHIGHVMNNAIGESLVRLAKFAEAEVVLMSYPSDFSIGIAKSVWAMLDKGVERLERLKIIEDKLNFLGKCYVDGVKAYSSSNEIQEKVESIAQKIESKQDGPELEAYNIGKRINLEYFKDITERLGSEFNDNYIFESEAGEVGKKIVLDNVGKIFKESDGAIIYNGEEDGLHTRVFINSQGRPVYEAKDLGLLKLKFGKFYPDESIVVTDNEQGPYFRVVLSVAGKIDNDWEEKTIHVTHGRMRFMGGRVSSRLDDPVPSAEKILSTLRKEVIHYADFGGITSSVNESDVDKIAIAALKFSILKNSPGKNINFDQEKSLSFEGDTGPYLQYTAVRANSLLEIAKQKGLTPHLDVGRPSGEVGVLERMIYRFPEIVERAWQEKAPQLVAKFLIDLAGEFNSFYAKEKIAEEGGEYKLFITKAVANILENGLYLLGIKVPSKM